MYKRSKFVAQWIYDLYVLVLKKNIRVNQIRVYLGADDWPYFSTISPTDGSWGDEYTVDEFIEYVHRKLKKHDEVHNDEA